MRSLMESELHFVSGGGDDDTNIIVQDIRIDSPSMDGVTAEMGSPSAEQAQACANDINGSAGVGAALGAAAGGILAASVTTTPVGGAIVAAVTIGVGALSGGGATAATSPNCRNP